MSMTIRDCTYRQQPVLDWRQEHRCVASNWRWTRIPDPGSAIISIGIFPPSRTYGNRALAMWNAGRFAREERLVDWP